jgi:hypothetical protein
MQQNEEFLNKIQSIIVQTTIKYDKGSTLAYLAR